MVTLVRKLFQKITRELHNSLVSDPEYGGLKESRYVEKNIIISDYTLRSLLLPTQLQKNVSMIQGHVWL